LITKELTPNGLTLSTDNKQLIFLINFLLFAAPLFLVTIRGFTNIVFAIVAILCTAFFFISRRHPVRSKMTKEGQIFIGCFCLPFLSVALSSLLRGTFDAAQFDSPLRFLLAIPIFHYINRIHWNTAKYLSLSLFFSAVITLIHQHITAQPTRWGSDRTATYFTDPLVFGYTALTFSLICLISIRIFGKETYWSIAPKIIGFTIGMYLSIKSGSRTGWAAIPLVLLPVFYTKRNFIKFNAKHLTIAAIASTIFLACFAFSTVGQRLILTGNDIVNYHLDGVAPDTSTGLRITFLRIAWDMFSLHPLAGYGETKYLIQSIPSAIYNYASEGAITTALTAGFHNELVTNGVRYGVIGLIASASLFLIPLVIFLRTLKSSNNINKANSLIGCIFVICFLASSISTEVFDLKYIASFYAMIVAMLCGSTLTQYEQE
jgi:O-antigen ligase